MTTGGCARYAFSTDAHYCLDRKGYPLINYTSINPHHHLIMTNSTMDLRIVRDVDPDGIEQCIFLLTGMLVLVDPGDHDSIDRHARYFDTPTENYCRGASRLYRLVPEKASLELVSGERIPLNLEEVVRRSGFSDRDERLLVDFANHCLRMQKNRVSPARVVGVDTCGVDMRVGNSIHRRFFPAEVMTKAEAELALTGIRDD